MRAGQVFSPRTPISLRELFAGRSKQINALVEAVSHAGLHAVIHGERGVGKTSLANIVGPLLRALELQRTPAGEQSRIIARVNANSSDTFASCWSKVFDEITWEEGRPTIGFNPAVQSRVVRLRDAFGLPSELSVDDVRRTLSFLPRSVFVIDEFDRIPRRQSAPFTDLIKALSDNAVASTIIIVGVSSTVDGLLRDHASIGRAIVQIPMPRMSADELGEILNNAQQSLGVSFEPAASQRIVKLSQGLPHYTHLVGLYAVRAAASRRSATIEPGDVQSAIQQAVESADQAIADAYRLATRSAQSGALHESVLLACALASVGVSDDAGYFQPSSLQASIEEILNRAVQIATYNRHLIDFCDDKRGRVLERTGRARSYRYRFRDPLMPPYIIIRGLANGTLDPAGLEIMHQLREE